jgi:hypothetical protein
MVAHDGREALDDLFGRGVYAGRGPGILAMGFYWI